MKVIMNIEFRYKINNSNELNNPDPVFLEEISNLEERVEKFILNQKNKISSSSQGNIILNETPEQKEIKALNAGQNQMRLMSRQSADLMLFAAEQSVLPIIRNASGVAIPIFMTIGCAALATVNPDPSTMVSFTYAAYAGAAFIGSNLLPVIRAICHQNQQLSEEVKRANRAEATKDKILRLFGDKESKLSDDLRFELNEIMRSISNLRKKNNRISSEIDKKIDVIESKILDL